MRKYLEFRPAVQEEILFKEFIFCSGGQCSRLAISVWSLMSNVCVKLF